MLYVRASMLPSVAAIGLFFSFIQLNYALSIVIGGILLCIALTATIISAHASANKFLYAIVLIYCLVSMDLGPFSRATWASETVGSGFINTPLTKFLLLFLAIHFVLIRKRLVIYVNFFIVLSLIVIAEGLNFIILGTTLSTWSMLIVLFILVLSSRSADHSFINPDLVHFALRVSIYAIGLRMCFLFVTNLLGHTDYLTFGQRPIISSLYVLSSVLLKKKFGLIDLLIVVVNLIPIGKGDLIHMAIVAILIPRIILLSLPMFASLIILFPNELIFIKLAELADIVNADNISTLLGVELSSSDSGSVGTRVAEFRSILSTIATYPHSLFFGLNGIGISTYSVSSLGGELTRFDYSDQEFMSGTIVNVHGFYNKLLYTTGVLGALVYIAIITLYVRRSLIFIDFRLKSKSRSVSVSFLIGIALLFQLYLSPEIAIVYFTVANLAIVRKGMGKVS